ncbi:MAG: hypothetical protein AAFV86_18920 [Pseudomonadota bacterium]
MSAAPDPEGHPATGHGAGQGAAGQGGAGQGGAGQGGAATLMSWLEGVLGGRRAAWMIVLGVAGTCLLALLSIPLGERQSFEDWLRKPDTRLYVSLECATLEGLSSRLDPSDGRAAETERRRTAFLETARGELERRGIGGADGEVFVREAMAAFEDSYRRTPFGTLSWPPGETARRAIASGWEACRTRLAALMDMRR